MARAKAKAARTTKGWSSVAPKSPGDRARTYARCGPGAFLMPNANPGKSKFPIMPKTGECVIDCRALRAAKARAAQQGYPAVVKRAERAARGSRCRWA